MDSPKQYIQTMKSRQQKRPGKQDLHFINAEGMVACNPRDREAAHRAEVDGIGTENLKAVTCKKCLIASKIVQ